MSKQQSVAVKAVASKTIKTKADMLEEIRKAKIQKIADSYKVHDRCAHIRSVGNGL